MKFSIFNTIAVAACAFAVLCSTQVEAKKKTQVADTKFHIQVECDPGMEIFCSDNESALEKMLKDIYAEVPPPDVPHSNSIGTMSTAERRKYNAQLMKANGLIADIKKFFSEYVKNLRLIFKGQFGQGIFNQLKSVGAWCEYNHFVVKIIKAGLNAVSGGAVSNICDCLYPMIKSYDSFDDLVADVRKNGLGELLNKCSLNLSLSIQNAIEQAP
ncbi:hypothetical protein BGX34_000784 [Mortierella sp. NVP85]|nr:hypothetical protein BGX34_000784 [Mortierella sp. NVP85]